MSKYCLKTIFYFSLALLISCSGDDDEGSSTGTRMAINPAFGAYIYAYTSGVISTQDQIIIQLANPYVGPLRSGSELPAHLLSFEPSIAGRTFWTDAATIRFQPDKPLPGGRSYRATFDVGSFVETERDLATFQFEFQTIRQAVAIYPEAFSYYSNKDLSSFALTGILSTADIASVDQLDGLIKASQNGKTKTVTIAALTGRRFTFTIENISRGDNPDELLIDWDLSDSDPSVQGRKTISIPALGDFSILKTETRKSPEQKLIVYFSDPISDTYLDGFVSLEDADELQFLVDGSRLEIFPAGKLAGSKLLRIDGGVKNSIGQPLKDAYSQSVTFDQEKPALRIPGGKSILPSQDQGLIFPFEAVSLRAVDVYITKIFSDNILQYLQNNTLGDNYNLSHVGRHIYRKRLDLKSEGITDLHSWNRYYLDLADIIKVDPGALYQVDVRFKQAYAIYECQETDDAEITNLQLIADGWATDGSYFVDDYWGEYEYNWEEQENPCSAAFYSQWNSRASKTVMATNLGLIAKMGGDGTILVAVNNILTTDPVAKAQVQVYDLQQQLIAEGSTGSDGFVQLLCSRTPFAVVATSKNETTFLKVDQGSALSVSKFEVEGARIQKGVKGFVYAERGVWRPGDSLYLNFILEDEEKLLPTSHPVIMELLNPRGQLVKRYSKTSGLNGFYDFRTATESDAPTGEYTAKITVGNRSYTKNLKIETVKPNRLKIDYEIQKLKPKSKVLSGKLKAAWLHGSPASHLKADVLMSLKATETSFSKFPSFHFDNFILNEFYQDDDEVFEGTLDEAGEADILINMDGKTKNAPGMLKVALNSKVYEPGGNFSVDFNTFNYAPFESFAGLKLPKSEMWGNALETNKSHKVELVNVTFNGNIKAGNELEISFFRISQRWWYDRYDGNENNFVNSNNYREIKKEKVALIDGKGRYTLSVSDNDWGSYLLMVKDPISGHSAAQFVYFDWPYWKRSNRTESEASTVLGFSSDKETYKLDEDVKLTFPSPDHGRALISIENGTKILAKYWVETTLGETKFSFKATADMSPNIFVHISLLQPHAQTANDRPLRMYGLVPLSIENPTTHLKPVLTSADTFRPETMVNVGVKEADGRAMTYTLAVVDEGLLGITRFKTPDPWSAFNAKEALGVNTWDIYDDVVGAFTEGAGKVLSIGGDDEGDDPEKQKAVRFKPVVRFSGPYHLPAGKSAKHSVSIPNYVGAVRIMVVAGHEGSYGQADKEVLVKSPLMVVATLPRVLGPGEEVSLPVNVFAMDGAVKDVTLQVASNKLLSLSENSKTLHFTKPGDQMAYFQMKTGTEIGVAKVNIMAKSGSESSTYTFQLDIRPPNPTYTQETEMAIAPGESWENTYAYFGIAGSNKAVLELSKLPSINLSERLDYLISYPHGCIEQITSSAFPQLYLSDIMELSTSQQADIRENVQSALQSFRGFQLSNGGLAYWPGTNAVSEWGSNYSAHFLAEAENRGFVAPAGLKTELVRFQKDAARNWASDRNRDEKYMQRIQAYRLYTLAVLNTADFGAMNLLKSQARLDLSARWLLALAYAEAGQKEVAEGLVVGQARNIPEYTELSYTYGNDLRDEAFVLETLLKLGMKNDAATVAKSIATAIGTADWLSTQTLAQCLRSLGLFMNGTKENGLLATVSVNGKEQNVATGKNLYQQQFDAKINSGDYKVSNTSKQVIFAKLMVSGRPLEGREERVAKNLRISVNYRDGNNNSIDVSRLKTGTDFIAEVVVTNPGTRGRLSEMALTQIFPSGWEILNPRMGQGSSLESSVPAYQDIRDDRALTYFDIAANSTLTFRLRLNAAYIGRFYKPATKCVAMYDHSILAVEPGQWVEVIE